MTISTVHYVGGEHRAVVWPGGVVLLDRSVTPATAAATWERLRNLPVPSTLDAVLTEVAEAIGARLLDLPPFAVAVATGPGTAHVAIRGAFEIEATSNDRSTTRVSGDTVSTWSERRLSSLTRLRIGLSGEDDDEEGLPIGSAVVGARLVVVSEATVVAAAPSTDDTDAFGASRDPDATNRADGSGHWVGLADAAAEPPAEAREPASDAPVEPEPEPRSEAPIRDPAAPRPPSPADEFDDIWADFTVAGSVEGAAVRPGVEVPPAPSSTGSRRSPSPDVTWLEDGDEEPDEPAALDLPPRAPFDKPATLAPPGDFVSSVPGMPPVPSSGVRIPPPPPEPPQGPPVRPAAALGDHDGDTIAGIAGPAPSSPAAPAPAGEDTVLGVICPSGHGNPPQRAQCRVCNQALTSSPTRISRPPLGRLIVSSGEQVELTGPVIIGRAPRASRFQGTEVPRLVTLPHPHISASHVALRVEGWSVLAVDLSSTNGTFLRRNGEPPFRILEQPQLLVPTDVIDLGHGVHLRFEELP